MSYTIADDIMYDEKVLKILIKKYKYYRIDEIKKDSEIKDRKKFKMVIMKLN